MDVSTVNILIMASAALIAIGLIAATVAFIIVGKAAFQAKSPSSAASFGLLFLALPTLSTIVLIILSTGTLTAMKVITPEGCIAIFSSVASFVLGSETERRKKISEGSVPRKRILGSSTSNQEPNT